MSRAHALVEEERARIAHAAPDLSADVVEQVLARIHEPSNTLSAGVEEFLAAVKDLGATVAADVFLRENLTTLGQGTYLLEMLDRSELPRESLRDLRVLLSRLRQDLLRDRELLLEFGQGKSMRQHPAWLIARLGNHLPDVDSESGRAQREADQGTPLYKARRALFHAKSDLLDAVVRLLPDGDPDEFWREARSIFIAHITRQDASYCISGVSSDASCLDSYLEPGLGDAVSSLLCFTFEVMLELRQPTWSLHGPRLWSLVRKGEAGSYFALREVHANLDDLVGSYAEFTPDEERFWSWARRQVSDLGKVGLKDAHEFKADRLELPRILRKLGNASTDDSRLRRLELPLRDVVEGAVARFEPDPFNRMIPIEVRTGQRLPLAWSDLTLSCLDEHTLEVRGLLDKPLRLAYWHLGMKNLKSPPSRPAPRKLWHEFVTCIRTGGNYGHLRTTAVAAKKLTPEEKVEERKLGDTMRDRVRVFSTILRETFPEVIGGDPFISQEPWVYRSSFRTS